MATNTRLAVREGRGDAVDALNEGDGRYKNGVRSGMEIQVETNGIEENTSKLNQNSKWEQDELEENLAKCQKMENDSNNSSEEEITQVKKSNSRKKRSVQNRILSRLTQLMEQMMTLTNKSRTRQRAGSNSSTEEITDASSIDSEVMLNFDKHTNDKTNKQNNANSAKPEQNKTNLAEPKLERNETNPEQKRTQNQTRPNIMPDKYDGSSDWHDYETHFDSCKLINDWEDENAVKYLSASLRGPALRLINERPHKHWTYDDLKARLSLRFSSSKQAESYLLELRGRKRRPNESLQELGRNIRELTTKAYPDFDFDGIDRLAKIHFTDSIQSPEIRTGIFHARSKTLDDMIEAAITTETFLLTESERSWKKNTHNRIVGTEQASKSDLQRTIDIAVEQALLKQNNQQCQNDKSTRTNKNDQTETFMCYYCQKPGHIARNCFKKQSDMTQAPTNEQQRPRGTQQNFRQTRGRLNENGPPMGALARPNQR